MDELFSVPEAAGKLGKVSKWTVYHWLKTGVLKKTRVGGRVMIAAKDLDDFIRRCNPDREVQ